jgi:ABC-type Mn2+/Zn2+ transport system ATPase subunit
VKLIEGVTGCVQPGEMLLVLGPPGSGCSTFIQALAGALHKDLKVTVSHWVCVCMRTNMYGYLSVCLYICMYVCMHVYLYMGFCHLFEHFPF